MDCPHFGAIRIQMRKRVEKAKVGFRIEKKLMLMLAGH
jgi:hypothetical protein